MDGGSLGSEAAGGPGVSLVGGGVESAPSEADGGPVWEIKPEA
jgi:hypothetical protein